MGLLIDRKRSSAIPYGITAAVMFIIPDIYIFVVGDHLPWFVFVIIGVIVTCTGTLTVLGIIRKVKAALAERQAALCPTGSSTAKASHRSRSPERLNSSRLGGIRVGC